MGQRTPPINKCICKAPRTQCSTCLFSTLVLNLQLLVRSTAIESHLPSGTASHIPRPPFCFAAPLSSFKSRRGRTCTPGATEKLPGMDPKTTARFHIFQDAPSSLFLFCSFFFFFPSLFPFGFNSGVPERVRDGEGVQRHKATLLEKRRAGEIGDRLE